MMEHWPGTWGGLDYVLGSDCNLLSDLRKVTSSTSALLNSSMWKVL